MSKQTRLQKIQSSKAAVDAATKELQTHLHAETREIHRDLTRLHARLALVAPFVGVSNAQIALEKLDQALHLVQFTFPPEKGEKP